MIAKPRIQYLNHFPINKNANFIIYWMQASQRTEYNHALEFAIEKANELGKPLIVFFGVINDYPEANERHYRFMLEGLKEVKYKLEQRGIKFVIHNISPELGVLKLSEEAAIIILDRGYLQIEKKWRRFLLGKVNCSIIQIENNVVVPVEVVSDKEEYGAYTIRPKIVREIKNYLQSLEERTIRVNSLEYDFTSVSLNDLESIIRKLHLDKNISKINNYKGGTSEALRNLHEFIRVKLDKYEIMRNNPIFDFQSNLSPYLHFGQISPIQIALEINQTGSISKEAFLEQLIIRRELGINFVFFNEGYDKFQTLNLPRWAELSLLAHEKDKREYFYSFSEFEQAKTHDPYWNAAQNEMVYTGKMHNYMRMYWGKKILEWTETPAEAHKIALQLNNKYELDGRDPNGYTGVAWIFGKHDRPWKERPIFGKVRYMNANGLKRKFNIDLYVEKINEKIKENS